MAHREDAARLGVAAPLQQPPGRLGDAVQKPSMSWAYDGDIKNTTLGAHAASSSMRHGGVAAAIAASNSSPMEKNT